jgi:hypothetical protein
MALHFQTPFSNPECRFTRRHHARIARPRPADSIRPRRSLLRLKFALLARSDAALRQHTRRAEAPRTVGDCARMSGITGFHAVNRSAPMRLRIATNRVS